jgi:DNA-binding beta-propeller fold protein YncE
VVLTGGLVAASGCAGNASDEHPRLECAAWTEPTGSTPGRDWPPADRQGYVNPIPDENALPGSPDWRGAQPAQNHILAYADHVSARAGGHVAVRASADQPRDATWSVYRVGWYDGAGGRQILDATPVSLTPQAPCPRDGHTAMIRCAWPVSFEFDVGQDWLSGLFLIRIDADGFTQFVPLVIVDDRPADLLAQFPVTTWEAYNLYGGESLYADASGTMPDGHAVQVSFDRPYTYEITWTLIDREANFARFAERWGYDVSYATNVDIAGAPLETLTERGAFVSVGHDEYWAPSARNVVEGARDHGVPLLFLGANDAYWRIRFDRPAIENPRSFYCYKSGKDPVKGPNTTDLFRTDRPESGLIGVQYENFVYRTFSWVVSNQNHFLFDGTGLQNGDSLPLLVGDEYDRTSNMCAPGNLRVAARSPVVDSAGRARYAETVTYRALSGALVFAAGTIDWTRGLGLSGSMDPRVERITANAIRGALGLPVPDGLGDDPLPPSTTLDYVDPTLLVGTAASGLTGPTSIALLPDGTMAITEPDLDRVVTIGSQHRLSVLDTGLKSPAAVVADSKGNLYVADTGNAVIRKLANDSSRTLTTVAGSSTNPGFADGTAARFNQPLGLALDEAHNLLYVADSVNQRVRAIDLVSGKTITVAGSVLGSADGPGAKATFAAPTALALSPDGRLFVVCSGERGRIAVIGTDAARTVTTIVAGGDGAVDGDGNAARLGPQGGAVWRGGHLLVSDPSNYLVRAITPGKDVASTRVQTLAGGRRFGRSDGAVGAASFGLPLGLAVAADGTLLIADGHNGLIRTVR